MQEIIIGTQKVPYVVLYKKIRHTYLRVKPEGYLQITANRHVTLSAIETFIRSHAERVTNELRRLASIVPPDPDSASIFGVVVPCRRVLAAGMPTSLTHGELWVPQGPSEEAIAKSIEQYYRDEVIHTAEKLLQEQAESLKKITRLSGIVLKSQRMKSQFGSCQTQKRIIKLNSSLGRFAPRYLEAILIHELVHLRVPNHGAEFYRILLLFVPEYRQIRRELNRLSKTLGG